MTFILRMRNNLCIWFLLRTLCAIAIVFCKLMIDSKLSLKWNGTTNTTPTSGNLESLKYHNCTPPHPGRLFFCLASVPTYRHNTHNIYRATCRAYRERASQGAAQTTISSNGTSPDRTGLAFHPMTRIYHFVRSLCTECTGYEWSNHGAAQRDRQ